MKVLRSDKYTILGFEHGYVAYQKTCGHQKELTALVKFVDVSTGAVFILDGPGGKVEATYATARKFPDAELRLKSTV